MYKEAEQNSNMTRGAGIQAATDAPQSPVQTQLQRKRELLSELEQSANGLIEPLKAVLNRDPRESKPVATQAAPGAPSSCELEAILMGENERVADVIDRLREIRNAIRL